MLHRYHFSIFLIICLTFSLNATIIDNIGVTFGGGQSFEIDYKDKTYSKYSFSTSFSIELFNTKYFSLKSFIGYDQKGSNDLYFSFTVVDPNNGGITSHDSLVEVKRKSDYLHVNVLGKFKILPDRKLIPYVLLGPRIDYLLKRTVEETWLGADEYDITDKTTKYLFGISSGIGIEINVNKFILTPFALCNVGFNKTKAEFGNEFRNIQYVIALELAYSLRK